MTIELGAAGHILPAGELLRALLLFICDTAVRTGDPSIDLGENVAALASRLGRQSKESAVREQVERILAATITVSVDDGPHRALLDRRSLPRGAEVAWRSSVRLGAGFHAGLIESAIPLDRAAVETLRDAPMALDAYAWARQALHRHKPGQVVTAAWGDLHAGFANTSQDRRTFELLFGTALHRAAEADPSLRLQITQEGVRVAVATGDADEPGDVQRATESTDVTPASDVTAPVAAQAQAASLSREGSQPEPVVERHEEPGDGARSAPTQDDRAPSLPGQPAKPDLSARPATLAETVSLRPDLTGLAQVIWLRRGYGAESALVGVTPTARFDADRLTLLAVEPLVMQVSGGLPASDFDQIAAWVTVNRDLIDDIWAGQVRSYEEISQRLRKAPPPAWR